MLCPKSDSQLKKNKILGIKGLQGYHLLTGSENAVSSSQPLALDMESISPEEIISVTCFRRHP